MFSRQDEHPSSIYVFNFCPSWFYTVIFNLKLFASGFNYDREYLIKFMGYKSDQDSFETAWLSSSQW